jgi:hypothetical protein
MDRQRLSLHNPQSKSATVPDNGVDIWPFMSLTKDLLQLIIPLQYAWYFFLVAAVVAMSIAAPSAPFDVVFQATPGAVTSVVEAISLPLDSANFHPKTSAGAGEILFLS